ncbi:uncharacterized protein LOC131208142 [Anopheles bellator]|uniref:uncharacterized protein LOC131208142 n=1 Tax=Anopheles bellator TaxID=139047 RepID=UPI0026493CB6|nr:uncharacterized protein LOC131208142 [Anopheles bellator]
MAPCSTARALRFWPTSLLLLLVTVASWQLSVAAPGALRRTRYPSRRFLQSDDSISGYYGARENYNTAEYGQEVGETDFHGDHDDSVEIEFEDDDHNEQEELTGASLSEESTDDDENGEDHQANLIAQLTALTHADKSPRTKHKGRSVVPPVTIAVPYPVQVERKVPVFIETKVPVYVEKKVEVPVQYQVPVYHREVIHVPKPVVFNVDRPYPVYVPRTVFKYAPVKVRIRSRTRY